MDELEAIYTLERYPCSDDGERVRLTEAERRACWRIAGERDTNAKGAGADEDKNATSGLGYADDLPDLTPRERNYIGCLGEIALAKWLDVEWSGGRQGWAEDDDVWGLQVRGTKIANGALRIYPDDAPEDAFTLAVMYHDGWVRLAGWRTAEWVRAHGNPWDDGIFFAPQRKLDTDLAALPAPRLPRYKPPPLSSLAA